MRDVVVGRIVRKRFGPELLLAFTGCE